MKLYCVYSQQFTPLYSRFFEASLRTVSPEVEIIPDVFEVEGTGNFRSPGFNQALIYKWKRGLEALYENRDQFILFTDVDIVFNKPLLPALLEYTSNTDIVVTPEAQHVQIWGANVGVLLLRSGVLVRQLISRILDEMLLRGYSDQPVFNAFLPQAGPNYKVLPVTFANGKIPYDRDSVLYHATYTLPEQSRSSLEMKMEALTKAEAFFASYRGK